MPQIPFSPCDPSQPTCSDVSVGILHQIFGPIIDVLVRGADPNTVASTSNVLATMFGYFNSGLLVVASLIISYVASVGAINTANDGEAMGKAWSSVWTPLRIVAGGAVLLPSASGYSFIQMFVLTLSLWSVGFANQLYRVGMTMGFLKTDNIVASSTTMPPSSFGLRDFAKQYLSVSYCAHVANAVYADQMGTPIVQANGQADRVNTVEGRVEYTFFVKDRNPATNIGGGDPICGTVKLTSYTPAGAAEATGTSAAIAALHSGLSVAKIQAATALMADINAWVATMPTDINQTGWVIESKRFNDIVKQREDALASQITAQVGSGTANVNNGISTFINELTKDGWTMAGGWYQRVGAIRKELGSAVTESVGDASEPSLSSLPTDARARLLQSSVSTVTEAIIKKSEEPGKGYDVTSAPAADIANALPKNINGDLNVGAIQQDINSKFGSMVNNTMKKTVDIATGSASDVDAVSRMKLVGDYLVVSMASAELAKAALTTSVAAVRAAVAGVGGVQVLGTKVDGSGSMTALWDWIMAAPMAQFGKLLSYLEPLAFYFSVFLPSLPYAIFTITVVGWILGVLQTVIAAPLWAIMHMRPSQTFIGSDAQGYLLLLALFVRPALAVIGLFAAMLVADPIVDHIAKAFFSMRGVVVTSTGLFPGALVEFVTFAWWLFAFGITLLPVLYMIYGLPQVLPDHVLKWINAGVHDLGATHAMSNVRGGLVMSHLQAKGPLHGGRGNLGGSATPTMQPVGSPGSGNGTAWHLPMSAGEQGVAPPADDAPRPSTAATTLSNNSASARKRAAPLGAGDVISSTVTTMQRSSPLSAPASAGEQGVAPPADDAPLPSMAATTTPSSSASVEEQAAASLSGGDADISSTAATMAPDIAASSPASGGEQGVVPLSADDTALLSMVETAARSSALSSEELDAPPPLEEV
jgi:conjugal transfer/type IV secretion protein DotA/TraY